MRRRSNDGATDLSWDDVKAEDKTLVYQVLLPACLLQVHDHAPVHMVCTPFYC